MESEGSDAYVDCDEVLSGMHGGEENTIIEFDL